MAKNDQPVKQVNVTHQGVDFVVTVYAAAVGYSGKWEGGGDRGDAGFMPTIDGVVKLASLRIQEHLRQKLR